MEENSKNNGMIATDVLAPTRVIAGKYHLGKVIGEGGMGSVYEAAHHDLGTTVAVKLLSEASLDNPKSLARFKREAKVMGQIHHENVISVMDAGTDEAGIPFLVMELLEGESLASTLRREMLLSPGLSAWIMSEILAGLGAAHAKNIVHRDLKPGNVFVATQSDGSRRVKLLDFGISKLGDDTSSTLNVTAAGALVGTPNYMAPEQIRANVELDGRIDLYAAGIMLYRMVTGKLPYVGSSAENLYRGILLAKPTPPTKIRSELSAELEQVIFKAFAPDRDNRFQSALEFRQELQAAVPSEQYASSRQLSSSRPASLGPDASLVSARSSAANTTDIDGVGTPATRPSSPGAVQAAVSANSAVTGPSHNRTWQWIAMMVIVLGAVVGGVLTYTITKSSKPKAVAETEPAIATQPTGEPLYFGVTRHKDPAKIKADLKPLVDYLATSIGRPIEIKIIDNYESFANSLASGEVDIVAMSAFNYVSTKKKLSSIQLLATPTNKRGSSYGAFIVARADSEIKELKDFKGRIFCYPSKKSSSGYVYPRAAFKQVGIDIDRDLRAREVPDHSASLKALLGGGCDGASVYDEVFKNADLADYTIIRNIKSIPWDAYCASGSLDAATTSALKKALTDLTLGSALAKEVLGDAGLNFSGFKATSDDFYDSVRELL